MPRRVWSFFWTDYVASELANYRFGLDVHAAYELATFADTSSRFQQCISRKYYKQMVSLIFPCSCSTELTE